MKENNEFKADSQKIGGYGSNKDVEIKKL